jgi:NADPH:quinone reductase-like Zn-dependent oxidoreductase
MKAITRDRYGMPEVLALTERERPAVKDREVLVRMRAAAIHPGDQIMLTGEPYLIRPMFGLRRPRNPVPGFDVAGTVAEVGSGATGIEVGDEVFGEGRGTLAEYTVARSDKLAHKPAAITFEQAAATPMSGLTALHALRDQAKVEPGQRVLVNGAAGGIGTFAVQLAKSYRAEVTGVCSGRNVELVRSLGADHVIDYREADFTRTGERYDVILDNVGNHSLSALRRALVPGGMLLPNNGTNGGRWTGTIGRIVAANLISPFVRQRLRTFVSTANRQDLVVLGEMLESGTVTAVIGQTYPLAEAPEAFRTLMTGHARGKLVITAGNPMPPSGR